MDVTTTKGTTLFLLTALLFLNFGRLARPAERKALIRWVVQKSSTLHIGGKTNVAPFGCAISGYYQTDTISYWDGADVKGSIPLTGFLRIPIRDFDCHNRGLTNDLRKTLKATEYPFLVVHFIALDRLPHFSGQSDEVMGWIDVSLAGVTKRFEIRYSLHKSAAAISLAGTQTFSFSQFRLVPPKKVGGIIKVKDSFTVNFRLLLNQLV